MLYEVITEPTETLNLYDGQPHSLTLFIYPLSSIEGFEQADPRRELVRPVAPDGRLRNNFV